MIQSINKDSYINVQKLSDMTIPFLIISKQSQLSFKVANTLDSVNSKVIACEPDENDLSQLWFIGSQISDQSNLDQFTNAATGLVMEVQDGLIYLRKGKLKQSQLFFRSKYRHLREPQQNNFIIKPSKSSTQAVCLNGALMIKQFVSNNQKFVFEFKPAYNSLPIVQSCILKNDHSNLVIDIPESSFQVGRILIQYRSHGKLNQRWVFMRQKQQNKFKIVSLGNALVMDIQFNGKHAGNKIIQNQNNNKQQSQLWKIQKTNAGFLFESCNIEGLYIGVDSQSTNMSAQIELVSRNNPSAIWKVIGKQPQRI